MNEKEVKKILTYLGDLVVAVSKLQEKPSFNSQKKGAEINTKESLTSQEHYTVADLIKTFIREKPELLALAKEVDDDNAPEFPTVDAHDDIIDIEEKIENAEFYKNNQYNQSNSVEKAVETTKSVEPTEPKVETTVVSESSSTVEK